MLSSYRRFRPFSDAEAWALFRIAAIGEAIGWSLLIFGVLCDQLPVSWHHIPVQITGQIHGMLFLIYIVASVTLGPSLGWPLWRTIIAGACSVPPYGSLIYEQISLQYRLKRRVKVTRSLILYRNIVSVIL